MENNTFWVPRDTFDLLGTLDAVPCCNAMLTSDIDMLLYSRKLGN